MINTNQNGRSMIEMLGVLAIIGVLSVGGIAGYSKAMEKMKINKTIQEISHISQNIRTLYFNQKSYDGGFMDEDILKSTGTVPEYMFGDETIYSDDVYGTKMYNAFGGGVYVVDDAIYNEGEYKSFDLIYTGIPKNICVELATKDWSYLDGLNAFWVQKHECVDIFPMYADCDDVETYVEWEAVGAIVACKSLLPIPVSKTVKACDCEDNKCELG